MNPETYTAGLGESIAAHRAYMGLSQRGMARRLDMERRSYQRIENGNEECPPGFIDTVAALVDQFDNAVEAVLDHARENAGVNVEVQRDMRWEWERNVAYRAHVLGTGVDTAPVRLTLVGEVQREAS